MDLFPLGSCVLLIVLLVPVLGLVLFIAAGLDLLGLVAGLLLLVHRVLLVFAELVDVGLPQLVSFLGFGFDDLPLLLDEVFNLL